METTKLSAERADKSLYITLYIHNLYWTLTKLYTHRQTHSPGACGCKLIYLVQHLEYLLVPGMKSVSIIDYLIDVANSRDIFGAEQTESERVREREERWQSGKVFILS